MKGYHRVAIDAYSIEMMLADIVRSAETIRSASLLEELDALCSALDSALANPRPIRAVTSNSLPPKLRNTRISGQIPTSSSLE